MFAQVIRHHTTYSHDKKDDYDIMDVWYKLKCTVL